MLSADFDLKRFRALTDDVWEIMEHTTMSAKQYHTLRDENVDANFFSPHVRFLTKTYLKRKGYSAESVDDIAIPQLQVLPNNGILIRFDGLSFRLLKTGNGECPVAGWSKKKREFYHQISLSLDWGEQEVQELYPNRIILWEVDQNHVLRQLYLVAPKAGANTIASVELHYLAPIPHPAEVGEQYYDQIGNMPEEIDVSYKDFGTAEESETSSELDSDVEEPATKSGQDEE